MQTGPKFYVTLCLDGQLGSGLDALDFKRKYTVGTTRMIGLNGSASAQGFHLSESEAPLFPAWFLRSDSAAAVEVDYQTFAPGEIVEDSGYLKVASDLDRYKLLIILTREYNKQNAENA